MIRLSLLLSTGKRLSIAETLRMGRLEAYKRNQSAISELPDSYRYLSLTLPICSLLEAPTISFRKHFREPQISIARYAAS